MCEESRLAPRYSWKEAPNVSHSSTSPEGAPDGFLDLVCHFITMDIVPEAGDTTATISGNLLAVAGGGAIEGTDSVNIVP